MLKQHTVAIVGLGLIGASLAHALAAGHNAPQLLGYDASANVRTRAAAVLPLTVVESLANLAQASVIILCVPVGAMASVMQQLQPFVAPHCIITDVGSVKQSVIADVLPHVPPHAIFVPAHPVAGTEKSGPEAGFATLFVGRKVLLTPLDNTPPAAIELMTALWQHCGAEVENMDAARHDAVFALVSHLPHLMAFCMVGTAVHVESVQQNEVIRYSASGFRDFTRLASSDPIMWRDIFLNNSTAVVEMLGRFTEELSALQRLIRNGEGAALEQYFAANRHVRQGIIDAGQG